VVRDVTAQKEAQRELLEKQELYQQLFDANPQPLWVYRHRDFANCSGERRGLAAVWLCSARSS
jgi:PAS domain-containing protein